MANVSVIIPVYNAERFLPICLATIEQNYSEGTQFIVVDDCSSDETPRILEAAQRRLPYLDVLRNEVNAGCARSRNLAFELVKRRYVTYLDVDDWYRKGHLDALVKAIEDHKVSFVRTNHIMATGLHRKRILIPSPSPGEPYDAKQGIGPVGKPSPVVYPYLWAGIYDTARIPKELFLFDESLRTAADRPWFWRLYMSGATVSDVELDGYFYRKDQNPKALTQAGNAQTLHFLGAMERTRDLVLASGDPEYIVYAAYGALRIVAFHLKKRARLSDDLRKQLYAGSSALLNSFPDISIERGLKGLSHKDRFLLRKILKLRPMK